MGRGKNKAKAKKVARDLKYNTDGIDFDSLAEELHRDAKKKPVKRPSALQEEAGESIEGEE